jgi:hypothetical protein
MIQPTPSKTPSNPKAEVSFSSPRSTKDGSLKGGEQFCLKKSPGESPVSP